jgi:multiple sugar transport system permease protein
MSAHIASTEVVTEQPALKSSSFWTAKRSEALWGYLMIAPLVLGLAIFFYVALGASALISFTKWDVLTPPQWIGTENYVKLFNSPLFWKTLANTTRYTVTSVPLGIVVSLVLAVALNSKLRFRNVYRLFFFLPVLTMPVAISVVWRWIYNPDFGLLNQILTPLGVPRLTWLSNTGLAMPALIIMSVWMSSGYGMVIFLAGLQNIPREYYEAADVDGATRWKKFLFITLPLLTPTIFFNVVTSLIGSFQVFDIIFTMTKGGPLDSTRTLVYSIYDDGFHFFRMGRAAAIGWVLFAIVLVLTIIQFRIQKRWVHYE